MTYPARLSEGSSLLVHMMLLARTPERILALRLAMSSAVGPQSVVLDAGCGSLGVLAIMAARLGARRVVAVDRGGLEAARALAEENGVADRIEFLQCDLADLSAATGSFDVILGMIYHNEPRRDLAQQQLMAGLATRVARPGTAFIPGTVRYTVAGYDSARPDPTGNTRQDRWASAVGRAEALTRDGLAEARRAILALRDDAVPLPEQLSSLAQEYRADGDVPVDFQVAGSPRPLAAEASLAAYRTAQEGLTNARKHAPGQPVRFWLQYSETEVAVHLTNPLPELRSASALAATGGGHGLTGLRERAALAGGTLTAGPAEGEWQVCLRIPA